MPGIDDPFLEEVEPSATQVGIDTPGARGGFSDFINFGVTNGGFTATPSDAAANIDPVTATGSNFLPGWRFVQESGTVTAALIEGGNFSHGSNLQLSASGPGPKAYIEQIIDIGGSSVRDTGSFIRVTAGASWLGGTDEKLTIRTQYLDAYGDPLGTERSVSQMIAPTLYEPSAFDGGSEVDPPSAMARYLRLRVGWEAQGVTLPSLTIYDIRRDRGQVNIRLVDRATASSKRSGAALYDVYQASSNLFWQPSSTTAGTTTGKRLLNYQLVPIPFSLVNIPQNATTDMQLWGDTALALATPRIGVPWPSAIVGASYRLSAIPTAGGANALAIRIQVGGSTVWTPFTIAGSGGAISNEASQVVTADELTAGQQIGVVVDTSSTYTPTTADIAVVVWVAVKYDGA